MTAFSLVHPFHHLELLVAVGPVIFQYLLSYQRYQGLQAYSGRGLLDSEVLQKSAKVGAQG